MNNYDIVFRKLDELTEQEQEESAKEASARELDEIEELRKFAAELMEPEPVLLTTTA